MTRATFIGLMLALIGPGIVALISQGLATTPETLAPRMLSLVLFIALLAAVAWSARGADGLTWRETGFAGSSWRSVLWAVPLAAFFVLLIGPAAYALLPALGLGSFDAGRTVLLELPRWYLAVVVLIVAGGEEWLYRGYAIERLEAVLGSAWLAGLVSLAAFGIVHLPLWGPGPALIAVVAGALFTGLYLWRRDVLMLIVTHVATDFYGLLIASPPAG